MPPKSKPDPKKNPKKDPKKASSSGGGKAKKKKWSKGKSRENLNNMVLFDKETYSKFLKEVTNYKVITPGVVSERMKIRVSLAKKALEELAAKNIIKKILHHNTISIYSRNTKEIEA